MMNQHYCTKAGTRLTTTFDDVLLDSGGDQEKALTRRIFRPQAVVNKKDATRPVQGIIMHQRRHTGKEPWKDADSFSQANLKAGQEVRMALSCDQTFRLYEALRDLHAITQEGLPGGGRTLAVVDTAKATVVEGDHNRLLRELIATEGENFWTILEKLHPGLLEAAALKRQHQTRRRMVTLFEKHLGNAKVNETKWQRFFEMNEWIFGHGLDYRYLHKIQREANMGGTLVDGKGAPVTDFLMATKARVGFTVVVEIKTPSTDLLGKEQYRNKAWELGAEFVAGVTQVQAQCALWAEEGSRVRENAEVLLKADVHTYEPKGILVIGNTAQFADDPTKRATFERFRRNLHNPEIVTFDELLERSRLMVAQPGEPTREIALVMDTRKEAKVANPEVEAE